MKTTVIVFVLTLVSLTWVSAQDLNRPESIVYDTANNRYLISNCGDGTNGSIVAYYPDEDRYAGFNSGQCVGPKGLAIFNNTLYASESGFINGFNLDNGHRTFHVELGSVWINDLTVDDAGYLYTGETNTGKIYRVNTSTAQVEEWITGGLEQLNGLFVDQPNNRLMVVFFKTASPVISINLTTKEITTLTETQFNNFDGITQDNCGRFYISSQGTKAVFRFDPDFADPPVIVVGELHKPADIFYNKQLDILCIPEIDLSQIALIDFFNNCQQPVLTSPENRSTENPGDLTLHWEEIEKIDYYRFELAEDEGFTKIITVDGTGIPEYTIENLQPGTRYYWRVSAYRANEHTEYSETWSFTTASTSSSVSVSESEEIRLFPNPASDSFTLTCGKEIPSQVSVYNLSGQKLLEFSNLENQNTEYKFNIEKLQPGIYCCIVNLRNATRMVRRLVIQGACQ